MIIGRTQMCMGPNKTLRHIRQATVFLDESNLWVETKFSLMINKHVIDITVDITLVA